MSHEIANGFEQHNAEIVRLRAAIEEIKARVVGERVPYWTDDWETTHSRGVIADICDAALTGQKPSALRRTS